MEQKKGRIIKSITDKFQTVFFDDKKLEEKNRKSLRENATKTGKRLVNKSKTRKGLLKNLIEILPNTESNKFDMEEFMMIILSNLWFLKPNILNHYDRDLIYHYYLICLDKERM